MSGESFWESLKSSLDEGVKSFDSFLSPHKYSDEEIASRNYIGSGLITLALYYVGFFFLGLISNIILLSETEKSKRLNNGNPPKGRNLLIILLIYHIVFPFFCFIIWFIMVFLGVGVGILSQF